jgi:tRNA-dihydrouridine synthase
MQYYFAPLEGITGYVYRSVHHKYFPGTDRYYMPFVAPNYTKHFKTREKQDVAPENNEGLAAVPQVLSNKADEALWAVEELAGLGYEEVNLNLGCPMPTVARKKKGSGLLKYTDELDAYLDGVFSGMEARPSDRPPVRISVKTRLGTDSTEEAEELVRIYNRYPISELIVHPRCQKDLYRGTPDLEAFLLVWQKSTNPVVYNGDITVPADVERIAEMCAAAGHGLPAARKLESVMIGRGFLADPSLVRQCQGGNKINAEELSAFHDELYSRFQETLPGTKVVLSHMKELWFYMRNLFVDGDKYMKDIRRANNRFQYEAAVRVLLSMGRMK